MELLDSVSTVVHLKYALIAIAVLVIAFFTIRVVRKIQAKLKVIQQRKAEQKRIQELRNRFKQDISTFISSYRDDISSKLQEEKTDKGLYVFWSGADDVYKKFTNDTSQINKLPSLEERIVIRGFYTEAKALMDGILYNNQLLKRYQYLHCKIKTTSATSAELSEVGTVKDQLGKLGSQLRQQHNELIASLKSVKAYY